MSSAPDESFIRYLKLEIERAEQALSSFISNFEKDPKEAFDWSKDEFRSAARLNIYRRILNTLTNEQRCGATMDSVREYATMEALNRASAPCRTTSPTASLMYEEETAAWASIAKALIEWA